MLSINWAQSQLEKINNLAKSYFGAGINSIRGYLDVEEMVKCMTTALASGGSVLIAIQTIANNVGSFISDPIIAQNIKIIVDNYQVKNWTMIAVSGLVLIIEVLRRTKQGNQPVAVLVAPPESPIANIKAPVIIPVPVSTDIPVAVTIPIIPIVSTETPKSA